MLSVPPEQVVSELLLTGTPDSAHAGAAAVGPEVGVDTKIQGTPTASVHPASRAGAGVEFSKIISPSVVIGFVMALASTKASVATFVVLSPVVCVVAVTPLGSAVVAVHAPATPAMMSPLTSPESPANGRPVAFVSVSADGVPRVGVIIAQFVVMHRDPVPLWFVVVSAVPALMTKLVLAVNVVNVPAAGVVPPIAPGDGNETVEPPRETEVPAMVIAEFARSAFGMLLKEYPASVNVQVVLDTAQ